MPKKNQSEIERKSGISADHKSSAGKYRRQDAAIDRKSGRKNYQNSEEYHFQKLKKFLENKKRPNRAQLEVEFEQLVMMPLIERFQQEGLTEVQIAAKLQLPENMKKYVENLAKVIMAAGAFYLVDQSLSRLESDQQKQGVNDFARQIVANVVESSLSALPALTTVAAAVLGSVTQGRSGAMLGVAASLAGQLPRAKASQLESSTISTSKEKVAQAQGGDKDLLSKMTEAFRSDDRAAMVNLMNEAVDKKDSLAAFNEILKTHLDHHKNFPIITLKDLQLAKEEITTNQRLLEMASELHLSKRDESLIGNKIKIKVANVINFNLQSKNFKEAVEVVRKYFPLGHLPLHSLSENDGAYIRDDKSLLELNRELFLVIKESVINGGFKDQSPSSFKGQILSNIKIAYEGLIQKNILSGQIGEATKLINQAFQDGNQNGIDISWLENFAEPEYGIKGGYSIVVKNAIEKCDPEELFCFDLQLLEKIKDKAGYEKVRDGFVKRIEDSFRQSLIKKLQSLKIDEAVQLIKDYQESGLAILDDSSFPNILFEAYREKLEKEFNPKILESAFKDYERLSNSGLLAKEKWQDFHNYIKDVADLQQIKLFLERGEAQKMAEFFERTPFATLDDQAQARLLAAEKVVYHSSDEMIKPSYKLLKEIAQIHSAVAEKLNDEQEYDKELECRQKAKQVSDFALKIVKFKIDYDALLLGSESVKGRLKQEIDYYYNSVSSEEDSQKISSLRSYLDLIEYHESVIAKSQKVQEKVDSYKYLSSKIGHDAAKILFKLNDWKYVFAGTIIAAIAVFSALKIRNAMLEPEQQLQPVAEQLQPVAEVANISDQEIAETIAGFHDFLQIESKSETKQNSDDSKDQKSAKPKRADHDKIKLWVHFFKMTIDNIYIGVDDHFDNLAQTLDTDPLAKSALLALQHVVNGQPKESGSERISALIKEQNNITLSQAQKESLQNLVDVISEHFQQMRLQTSREAMLKMARQTYGIENPLSQKSQSLIGALAALYKIHIDKEERKSESKSTASGQKEVAGESESEAVQIVAEHASDITPSTSTSPVATSEVRRRLQNHETGNSGNRE